MRLVRNSLLLLLLAAPSLPIAACGGGDAPDNDPFDTYQACWDEHHTMESLPVQKAIVICCIDHPIGNQDMNVVCGNTAGDCEAYVSANLTSSEVTPQDITAACSDYITQRSM